MLSYRKCYLSEEHMLQSLRNWHPITPETPVTDPQMLWDIWLFTQAHSEQMIGPQVEVEIVEQPRLSQPTPLRPNEQL